MIDIHSHILPGVDDGAENLDESVAMARAAVEEGMTSLIATPHHANGKYSNEASVVHEAVKRLNEKLQSCQIPLHIYSGQEIRVYHDLIEDLHEKRCISLVDSKYILIEFPSAFIPVNIDEIMHELQILNLVPIIAHPERNQEIAINPDKLYSLVKEGALSQITSHSINGRFGKKIQKLSFELCRRNLVHFIASDAHNMSNRAFGLREAYQTIDRKLDPHLSEYYRTNADLLLNNQEIHTYLADKEKKWFQFWTK